MKYTFILVLLMSFTLQAKSYLIAGQKYEFKETEGLVLKGCERGCIVLKKIKAYPKIDLKKLRVGLKVASSPGSDVCHHAYHGKTLLGRAGNGDQRAFCLFKDKSMVELNSLGEYLIRKKVISE